MPNNLGEPRNHVHIHVTNIND